jgi:hypothetical protein
MSHLISASIRSLLFSAALLFNAPLIAQPPAEGPAPTGDPYKSFSMGIILNGFEQTVQKTLDSVNANIQAKKNSTGISARVSYSYIDFPASLEATLYPDRPNENQVHVPLMVTYSVTGISYHGIPYFDRNIYETIDMYSSCHNWTTGQGYLQIAFTLQPPYQDGYSFGEDVLDFFITNTLSSYIDGRIAGNFQIGGTQIIPVNTAPCNCLGVTPGTESQNHYKDGEVRFDYKRPRTVVTGATAINRETVTISSITRLVARDNTNAVLYQPAEDVSLQVYVNESLKSFNLGPMKEGDTKQLPNATVSFPVPGDDGMVVIIVNLIQNSYNYEKDTGFGVYTKTDRFGGGAQQISTPKYYWQKAQRLPGGGMSKPFKITVQGYEVSMQINLPSNTNRL